MSGQVEFVGRNDGPTLVFSNALGCSSAMWTAQVSAFQGRYRIALYDHPPLASVDQLAVALLEELTRAGVERLAFCGLSLGAMVGMQIAATEPRVVESLALCCTSARFGQPQAWRESASVVRAQGMGAVAHDALDKWFTPSFANRQPFLEMQLAIPPDAYARGLEAISGFDFRDRLGTIKSRTLVIAGTEDVATPPRDARVIADGIPTARLVLIEQAAHIANVEQPAAFNTALEEHLHA